MSREYNEAMNDLRFSPEAKKRMAANLAAAHEQAAHPRPDVYAVRGGKRRWRYAAAVAAAVVLVVGVGGVASATGNLMSMANVFDDLFNGPPAQTEVVDKIGRPIGASATSNGVTVTAEAIIGDRTNYAVVFSIAKDDGTAFEGIEPLESGILPLGFESGSSVHVDGVMTGGGSGHFYDADPSDNAIQYVEQMSVTTIGGSIIGHTARVSLSDLKMYDGSSSHVIAEGEWNMKFAVDYEDTSVDLPAGQTIKVSGMDATLDSATVSPIALTLEYTVHEVLNWEDQQSGRMSDHNQNEMDRFLDPSVTLNMKDGTTVEIDALRGAGGTREGANSTACNKSIMFDEFLNLDDVASITIGGAELPLP